MSHVEVTSQGESASGRQATGRPFPLGAPWKKLPDAPARPGRDTLPARVRDAAVQHPPAEAK